MNKYIAAFLEQVCQEVKYKGVHKEISRELEGHLEEIMLEYVSQGMTEDEAAKRAVLQMGNPIKIGQDLHKTHRPKTEWSLVGLVAIMVLIGAGALFSLASDSAANMFPGFFARHLVNAFIGIAVALGCYFMNYTKLEKYSLHIFLVTLVVLYLSQIFSVRVDGTHYVVIGPFSFMAGLMTLPFLLISFSGLLNRWFFNSLKDRVIVFGLAFLAVIMSLLQGSLVTTMLLITGLLVLITMAIIDKKFLGPKQAYLVAIYGGVMAVLTLFLLSQPYRTRRLLSFLNPTSDPTGEGYLSMTLRNILAGAKLWGSGEGLYINHTGTLYSFALPEMNTEFILAYIISAFGWLAGIVVITIAMLAIFRMFLASQRIKDGYGKYLVSSIVTVFALQIISNVLMNLGLFPILGISLPFISYGGSNFVANMALVGLMLGVYRRKDLIIYSSVKHSA